MQHVRPWRVRVEIDYVELLHAEAATIAERRRLVAESEARPASRARSSSTVPGHQHDVIDASLGHGRQGIPWGGPEIAALGMAQPG